MKATSARIPWLVLPNGWPAFKAAIVAGVVAGAAVGTALAEAIGLPRRDWRLAAAAAIASALLYVYGNRFVTRTEDTAFFRLLACLLAGPSAVLVVAGAPVLPALDVLAVGLAVNQVFGRAGCLLAGCCHGRPARHGLSYGPAHVEAGFPAPLVGVPLVPIPLVEGFFLAALAAGLARVSLAPHVPGAVLALYLTGYATLRFALEPVRGDADRAYRGGFSEAQWISLAVAISVAALASLDGLPTRALHLAAAAGLSLASLVAALRHRLDPKDHRRLLLPRHVLELAAATRTAVSAARPGPSPEVHVETTSLGVRLSGGIGVRGDTEIRFLTVSRREPSLTPGVARRVARLVAAVVGGDVRLVPGGSGVFHLLLTLPEEAR